MQRNLFFILVPLGGRGVCACVGKVCYKNIVYILKSNKNSIFFTSTSNLCRTMLPNYVRTYSRALCQIRALEKAFKKPNNGKSVPKLLVLNVCILIGQNKQSKFTCNTLRISSVTMTCAELCSKSTWGHIPQLFANFEPGKRHLRRVTSAKRSQKSGV